MLKNIDFNKNRQRWKNYFCLFISFLFLIFFYVNRTTILENDPEFSSKFKIASIVLGWIVGRCSYFCQTGFWKEVEQSNKYSVYPVCTVLHFF